MITFDVWGALRFLCFYVGLVLCHESWHSHADFWDWRGVLGAALMALALAPLHKAAKLPDRTR